MSANNSCVFAGRLTKDPETGNAGDRTFTKFSIAVDRGYKDKEGKYITDFIDVVTWNKLAEICSSNLNKGRLVIVSGSMYSRNYEAKDGTSRRAWELNASEVTFLDSKNSNSSSQNTQSTPQSSTPVNDEDVPF
jgi:single-strand DNA-binding protein